MTDHVIKFRKGSPELVDFTKPVDDLLREANGTVATLRLMASTALLTAESLEAATLGLRAALTISCKPPDPGNPTMLELRTIDADLKLCKCGAVASIHGVTGKWSVTCESVAVCIIALLGSFDTPDQARDAWNADRGL